jgi:cob(I)alamin adenosyltransferase
MKIYTRTGDQGQTGLYGGARVHKSNPIIEALGEVDELNSALGVAVADCKDEALREKLLAVQHILFDLGAEIGSDPTFSKRYVAIDNDHIQQLEDWIDETDEHLEPLRAFVLPGGSRLAAQLHHARTVCRRVERRLYRDVYSPPLRKEVKVYVNRLSDWLFVAARYANHLNGVSDVIWNPEKK